MNPALHTKEEIQLKIDAIEERMYLPGFDEEYQQTMRDEIKELTKWL